MAMVLYYVGLACLLTHELDAVTHSEWRLLFFLRDLPDATASPVFVAAHVPLFFLILWLSHHSREVIRRTTRIVVAGFFVFHAVLHFSLESDPANEFHGALSRTLIAGAALFGAAYLAATWRAQRAS